MIEYIGENDAENIGTVGVKAVPFSDHDAYYVSIGKSEQVKWGRGVWKLNVSLLLDGKIKSETTKLWETLRKEKELFDSVLLWWDYAKQKVKFFLIEKGKEKSNETRKEQNYLEEQLEDLVSENGRRTEWTDEIREVKNKLDDIEKHRLEGQAVRSRAEYIEYGEKSTKYFFDLERERGRRKKMTKIKQTDGTITENKKEICAEVLSFYETLYTKENIDNAHAETLVNNLEYSLNEEDQDELDGFITDEEAIKAIKNMENNKAPGMDGLPKEFYGLMWPVIEQDIIEVFNCILLTEAMPPSMTEGLITLIYKEKGDIADLKNWRPITLMNVDYKILMKILADRIKPVMHKLVSPEQACGVHERTIHDQLYLLQDCYDFHQETTKTGLFVAIDQEKAFDRLSHEFLLMVLERMKMPPDILDFIRIIYSNMTSRININGLITGPFDITRSVRQGCPLSMLLFVLVAETLNQSIKKDDDIRGLKLPNTSAMKITQYADDTTALVKDIDSFKALERALKIYEKGTGAKVNEAKTEILLLGRWLTRDKDKLPQHLIKDKIKILGVPFGDVGEDETWDKTLKAIDGTIARWERRNLSRTGKILVIKTLLYSKIWHIVKVKGMSDRIAKEIEQKTVRYLWNPRRYTPIKTDVIKNAKKTGGIEFPDVKNLVKAYLLMRISEAMKYPDKIWYGMFIYRLGFPLRNVNPHFVGARYIHATNASPISRKIHQNYCEVRGKIADWNKVSLALLAKSLRNDVECAEETKTGRNLSVSWKQLWKSSNDNKETDHSYLVMHDRLPLGEWLKRTGISEDDTCRLCGELPENREHLYIKCTKIQQAKASAERDIRAIIGQAIVLTEEEIIYLQGKLLDVKRGKTRIGCALSHLKYSIWRGRAKAMSDPDCNISAIITSMYQSMVRQDGW